MIENQSTQRARGAALFTAGGLFVALGGYLFDTVSSSADTVLGPDARQRTQRAQLVAQAYRRGFQAGASAERARQGGQRHEP